MGIPFRPSIAAAQEKEGQRPPNGLTGRGAATGPGGKRRASYESKTDARIRGLASERAYTDPTSYGASYVTEAGQIGCSRVTVDGVYH